MTAASRSRGLGRERLDAQPRDSPRPASRVPATKMPGAAIGAGVVAAMRGVGLPQARCGRRWSPARRGDLACTVVVPLPNSAVPTVSSKPPSSRSAMLESARWPAGGMVSIMVSATPSPTSQSGGEGVFRCVRGHRALDQIEALVEAVGAIEHVVIFCRRRRQHGIARLDHVAAAEVEGADAELPCKLVDRGLDGESATVAGRSRGTRPTAPCWCRRRPHRPSCSGSCRR